MPMSSKAVLTRLGDAPTDQMRLDRGTVAKLVGLQNGALHVDLHVNVLAPESGPGPYHYHADSDNVYFVLHGEILVVVEGEEFRLGANDVLFIPPGLRHATSNCGDGPARFIEIYAPSAPDFHLAEAEQAGT